MVGTGRRWRRGRSVARAVALGTRGPCRAGASSQGPFLFPIARFWGASSDYRAAPHGREPPELTWGGEDEEGLLHPPRGRGSHGTNRPGCFFGLDGGEKRGENNEGSGSALWGNEEAAEIPKHMGLGPGSSRAEHSPSSLRGPAEPPSLAGSTETPQRCLAHPIYLHGPARILAMGHEWWRRGAAPGSVGSCPEPVLVTSARPRFASPAPRCSGFAAGAGGGRAAWHGGGGSEHLEEPRWWQQQGGSCAEASAAVT